MIVAIVLGAIVGLTYGDAMWRAGGGLDGKIERLRLAFEQKSDKLEALPADAAAADRERLVAQLATLEAEIAKTEAERTQTQADIAAGRYTVASMAWTLVRFVGDLFLQVLRLLVVPLVVTSMICGITSLGDIRRIGRLGGATLAYYIGTTALAVLAGIILVLIIQPGVKADDTFAVATESVQGKANVSPIDTLLNVVRGREDDPGSGMFPSNIFLAASTTNVLALIVFAMAFGGAITTLGPKGQVVIDFFYAANEAVMKMVHLVMLAAPVGIFGLVAYNIAKNGGGTGFYQDLSSLAWYAATVIIGLALHAVALMGLLAVLGRRNPLTFTLGVAKALLTAGTTASSSATLPVSMECVEQNCGVSNRTASFVIPLGATINMNGTALYEAVAAIYIAQQVGIELGIGQLLVIFLTASLAAVGAAGIPEAGLVTMVIVLTAVGLPIEGIGMILAIDWFLDRIRTTENVFGDLIGAGILDRWFVPNASGPFAEGAKSDTAA